MGQMATAFFHGHDIEKGQRFMTSLLRILPKGQACRFWFNLEQCIEREQTCLKKKMLVHGLALTLHHW